MCLKVNRFKMQPPTRERDANGRSGELPGFCPHAGRPSVCLSVCRSVHLNSHLLFMASGTQHLRGFEPAQAPLFRVQYKHDSCPLGIVTSGSSRRRVWLTEVLSAGGKKHFVFVIRVVCVSVGVVVVVLLICVVEPLGSVATLNSNIILFFMNSIFLTLRSGVPSRLFKVFFF